jgi:hypothetical protein
VFDNGSPQQGNGRKRADDESAKNRHGAFCSKRWNLGNCWRLIPLFVGAVYIEEDFGSDDLGDTFVITFQGGAPGTQLTRVEIDGDKAPHGLSRGDMIFDTVLRRPGCRRRLPVYLVSFQTKDPSASVRQTVEDGSSLLVLEFTNFQAGDKLIFSIDVDECWNTTRTKPTWTTSTCGSIRSLRDWNSKVLFSALGSTRRTTIRRKRPPRSGVSTINRWQAAAWICPVRTRAA